MSDSVQQFESAGVVEISAGSPSDGSLLVRYQAGSHASAERLVHRYAARLTALARVRLSSGGRRHTEPEEIVQSVFRRFFKAVDSGTLRAPRGTELRALLFAITVNRVRSLESFLRAQRRDIGRTRPAAQTGDRAELAATSPDPSQWAMVEDIISQLPDHFREVVRLRLQNCEVEEIARLTRRSKRTTERLLHEVRLLLRRWL